MDAASFTDGELESVFSLFSSAAVVVGRPKRDPKPLNSGTASLSGVAGLSEGVRLGIASSLSGVAGLSDGVRFANESGWTAGAGLVWLVLKLFTLGLGDTAGLVWLVLKLATLGFGDTEGLEKDVEFETGLSTRSLGLVDGLVWLVPREAAMIEAVELTPPNLAEGLMAGEGLVASVGEEGASRDVEETSLDLATSSCFGASGSGLLTSGAEAPPFLFFGPLALPLRTSAKGAPSACGSLEAAAAGLDDALMPAGLSDLEPLGEPPFEGGPRARIPARPGLKRAASLLVGAATGAATGGYVSRLSSAGGGASRFSTRGRDIVFSRGSVVISCFRIGDGRRLAGSVAALVR